MASFVLPPLFMLLLSWQWQWHLAYGFGCSTIASSSKVSSPSSCSWHHCDHRYLTPFIAPTCRLNRRKVQLLRSTALFSTVAAPPPPHINDSVTSTAAATPSPSPPPLTFRVGIIGSGSIAYGTASLIASLGHDPMVWSPSGTSAPKPNEMPPTTTVEDSAKTLTAASETFAEIQCTGVIEHNFNVRIAHSPNELVRCNDGVLIVALPANGHKSVMDTLSPVIVDHLLARYAEASTKGQQNQQYDHHSVKRASITTPPMHIIISSHASLGAVYFMQSLRDECHKRRQKKMNGDDDDGFSSLLNNHDILEEVRITSWGTTAITARKTSDNTVRVTTVRQLVDYCTVPTFSTLSSFISSSADDPTRTTSSNASRRHELLICNDGYELCTTLFGPRFRNRKGGLLAISLSNLNPQAHLGIVLGNMSRMDPPPPPPPLPNSFTSLHVQPATSPDTSTSSTPPSFPSWYQGQNITPNIGRLMEALDTERIAIAKALGIEVRTIHEHFSWSFHVPMETLDEDASSANESSIPPKMRPLTVSEMNQQMHHYLKNDVLGPSSPNSRYVLEDVPYGLVLTILLGKLVNKPAVLHESGIRILSAMYGRDFMEENDLLRGLGLLKAGNSDDDEFMRMIPSLDHWKEMANTGMFHARD
ncbi:hypothetical protein ACHAWU_003408 [Discostella pseudostelligera]|uniref:Opine dehydrogenase domain-containing protein n=1 Tax=Discostella pseudostelligera TaxID=259834 RepID=A0ABD3MT58_9STRA